MRRAFILFPLALVLLWGGCGGTQPSTAPGASNANAAANPPAATGASGNAAASKNTDVQQGAGPHTEGIGGPPNSNAVSHNTTTEPKTNTNGGANTSANTGRP